MVGENAEPGLSPAARRLVIIAPGPPKGGWDETAEAIRAALLAIGTADEISVLCRPGGGGTRGLAEFVGQHRGDPDALLVGGYVLVGAVIGTKSPATLADVTPLARLTGEYEAIAVAAGSSITSLGALCDRLRREPQAVEWAVGSLGGVGQVAVGLVCRALGIDPRHARFQHHPSGGEAAAAAARGEATAVMTGFREILHLGPALRVLGVAAGERLVQIDAPTLTEAGVPVEIMNWRMVAAAPAIDPRRQAELSDAVAAMVASAAWREQLAHHGWEDRYLAGAGFRDFLREQIEQTSHMLQELGVG